MYTQTIKYKTHKEINLYGQIPPWIKSGEGYYPKEKNKL